MRKTEIICRIIFLFYVPFRIAGKEPKWTEVTHKKRANTDGCHLRIFCKSRIFYNVSVNFGDCGSTLSFGIQSSSLCLSEHIGQASLREGGGFCVAKDVRSLRKLQICAYFIVTHSPSVAYGASSLSEGAFDSRNHLAAKSKFEINKQRSKRKKLRPLFFWGKISP